MEDSAQKKIPRPATLKLPNKALRYVSLSPATSEVKFIKNHLILVAVLPFDLFWFNTMNIQHTCHSTYCKIIKPRGTIKRPRSEVIKYKICQAVKRSCVKISTSHSSFSDRFIFRCVRKFRNVVETEACTVHKM